MSEVIVQQTRLLSGSKLANNTAMKQFIREIINNYIDNNRKIDTDSGTDLQFVLLNRDRFSAFYLTVAYNYFNLFLTSTSNCLPVSSQFKLKHF